ncbi:NmrA domain-containing protein [Rhizoctonia solani AG-1 IA]|uniref:NmrA domain-containing protein n=1 Tax=Thanatephorus cucumeris (strain AG1-IA) TaxID=983506 RepID=L8X4A7_THACA|nr:NmrA domain-containing protein [Rhizoctonia solani AG-1 IA]
MQLSRYMLPDGGSRRSPLLKLRPYKVGQRVNKRTVLPYLILTMSTAQSPLVVVCGATGSQGSSVAQYLLRDGGYRVRALTRNPASDKVQSLKKQGAEIFGCDLVDKEQVKAALNGAYAVFGVTNFWEHGEDSEIRQGINLADAAIANRLEHFVWSAKPLVTGSPKFKLTGTSVNMECLPLRKLLPFRTGQLTDYRGRLPDGSLILDWIFPSEVRIPSFSVEDLVPALGLVSATIISCTYMQSETGIVSGREMKLCSEVLTPQDYAAKLSIGLDTKVLLKDVTIVEFEAIRSHVPPDVWLNKQLFPELQNLEEFSKTHKDKLLAAALPT